MSIKISESGEYICDCCDTPMISRDIKGVVTEWSCPFRDSLCKTIRELKSTVEDLTAKITKSNSIIQDIERDLEEADKALIQRFEVGEISCGTEDLRLALRRQSKRTAQQAEVKKEDYVRLNCGHLGPAVLEGIANTFNKNSGGLYVRGCPSCSEQAEAKKEE